VYVRNVSDGADDPTAVHVDVDDLSGTHMGDEHQSECGIETGVVEPCRATGQLRLRDLPQR